MVKLVDRERDAELGKLSYLVSAWSVISGIDAKLFDKKVNALREFRTELAETLYQDTYNPDYKAAKLAKQKQELEAEKNRMRRIQELGKE